MNLPEIIKAGFLSPEEIDKFRDDWNAAHRGARSGFQILENGVTIYYANRWNWAAGWFALGFGVGVLVLFWLRG